MREGKMWRGCVLKGLLLVAIIGMYHSLSVTGYTFLSAKHYNYSYAYVVPGIIIKLFMCCNTSWTISVNVYAWIVHEYCIVFFVTLYSYQYGVIRIRVVNYCLLL